MPMQIIETADYPMMDGESLYDYRMRICELHNTKGIRWHNIAKIINDNTNSNYDESTYRKQYREHVSQLYEQNLLEKANEAHQSMPTDDTVAYARKIQDKIDELKKERVKLADERTQNNAYIRRLSREETLIEIGMGAANTIAEKYPYIKKPQINNNYNNVYDIEGGPLVDREGILAVSDWHYGADINNYWNVYNTEIARDRISSLTRKSLEKLLENNVKRLHLVNLGDMIEGNIHLQLRIQSRIDVITQTIEISEIIAQMMSTFEDNGIEVFYYDCLDNHSRIMPDKKESLDVESLCRIIKWYLKERFKNSENIHIVDNTIDDDMIEFGCCGYRIGGVHGHKDKVHDVASNLTMMCDADFDLILTAHRHHFSADEQNKCIVLCNGTLMGTDEYSKNLRLTCTPSQNLIIASWDNPTEIIYRIIV